MWTCREASGALPDPAPRAPTATRTVAAEAAQRVQPAGSERALATVAILAHGRFKEVEVMSLRVLPPTLERIRAHDDASQGDAEVAFQPGERPLLLHDEIFESNVDPVLWARRGFHDIELVLPRDGPAQPHIFGAWILHAVLGEIVAAVLIEDAIARVANPEDIFDFG